MFNLQTLLLTSSILIAISHLDARVSPRGNSIDYVALENEQSEAEGLGSTLRQVLILHRHGDRTPTSFAPKDNLAEEPFWQFHGIGQLTNVGKARLYELGKMMRSRYDRFLEYSVNKNQRISRSSSSSRCIESAQSFLAGLMSLDSVTARDAEDLRWDGRSNRLAQIWQPINVQVVPDEIDGLLPSGSCSELTREFRRESNSNYVVNNLTQEYAYELQVLEDVWGSNYENLLPFAVAVGNLAVEKTYFEDKLDDQLLEIYDRVQEAGYAVYGTLAATPKAQRLLSGVLVDDMIKSMLNMRDKYNKTGGDSSSAADTKRLVHYSAHDLNIVSLLHIFEQWRETSDRPGFGAAYVIELHQDEDTDEWYLKFLYWRNIPGEMAELKMDRCNEGDNQGRCLLDKFVEQVDGYRISSWMQYIDECKIDLADTNIYATD